MFYLCFSDSKVSYLMLLLLVLKDLSSGQKYEKCQKKSLETEASFLIKKIFY